MICESSLTAPQTTRYDDRRLEHQRTGTAGLRALPAVSTRSVTARSVRGSRLATPDVRHQAVRQHPVASSTRHEPSQAMVTSSELPDGDDFDPTGEQRSAARVSGRVCWGGADLGKGVIRVSHRDTARPPVVVIVCVVVGVIR